MVCMEVGYPYPVSPQHRRARAGQSQGWAEPYLGPATDEQIQHVLTDLVVVFIQKLVNLAKSKSSW